MDSIILGLCRLTDPKEQRGNQNVSVFALCDLGHSELQLESLRLAEEASRSVDPIRKIRDKRLAHADYFQKQAPAKLPLYATAEQIWKAISAIHRHINWISKTYFNTELTLHVIARDSATEVLMTIEEGNEFRRRRKREWEAHIYKGQYELEHRWIRDPIISFSEP